MTTINDQAAETIRRLGDVDLGKARDALLDASFWADVGPRLTCVEAEALGALLIHAGAFDGTVAHLIVEGHGATDDEDEGDRHHHEEEP